MISREVSIELLKHILHATRPQLEKALLGIKTAKPHTKHQIGGGIELTFTKRTFIVVRPDIMVS